MTLPLGVTLVAFATELFRISRNHRLDRRGPGMQAQTVEAALELLEFFDIITGKGGNASVPVASAVSWFTFLVRYASSWASISLLSVCDFNLKPSGLRRSTPAFLFNSDRDIPKQWCQVTFSAKAAP